MATERTGACSPWLQATLEGQAAKVQELPKGSRGLRGGSLKTRKTKRAVFGAVLLAGASTVAPAFGAEAPPSVQIRNLTVDIHVAANGGSVETIHSEIRANNAATAMRLGQTAIGYDSSLVDLKIVEAHTLKQGGAKIPVSASAIYDQAAPDAAQAPMFTEQRAKTIVFPQFASGDTAVYTIRLTSKQPLIARQYWYGDLFSRIAAFDNVRETITAPKSLPLAVENHGVAFSKSARGNDIVYSWRYAAPKPVEAAQTLVSPLDSEPRFFVSTFKNYAELGRIYARLSDPMSAVTPKIRVLANQITGNVTDRRIQAQRIYEWVSQHIRYVAVELGKGSLEPHAAETVLSNGYGDCKDHVVLLSALLKAKNIASYGVLINATNSYTLTSVPTFIQLDHIIIWIPEFKTYADSSAIVAPFGILPFQEYGKPVVYVDQVHAAQGRIPVLQPGLASVTTRTASHLGKDGVLSGVTTTSTSGPYTILLRSVGLAAQALGSTAAAEKLLASLGYAGATGTLESGTPTDLQPNYTTTGTFSAPGWSDKLDGTTNFYLPGGMRLMGVSGDGLMGPFYPGKLAVTQPTQCYSGHAAETLSLQIPPSVRFSSVPHDVLVKTANITFRAHWSLNKNTLTVHRDFASTVDQPLCTDALRKQTAAALKEISDSYDIELSLVPPPAKASATMSSQNVKGGYKGLGIRPETLKNFNAASAAIQNSDFDNGIRLLTAVLADKSLAADQRYVTYTNRASAYYRAGRFQQAIDDISQAIKLKKDDARAYGIRASLFERTGNQTAALSDFAAYTRLAPNDRGVRVESGNLNFQDANYAAAIKDFSAALAMNGNDSQTLVVRGMAYEKLGDYDHAAADFGRAATMGDIDQNGETRYCAALSRGHKPSLAIPQCEISLRADPYSGDSLQARGYAYFRLGKYKDALKDFTAANHVYPANAEYLYSRGAAKLRLGDKSGGNQDLQAARQISPGVDQKMAAWRLVP